MKATNDPSPMKTTSHRLPATKKPYLSVIFSHSGRRSSMVYGKAPFMTKICLKKKNEIIFFTYPELPFGMVLVIVVHCRLHWHRDLQKVISCTISRGNRIDQRCWIKIALAYFISIVFNVCVDIQLGPFQYKLVGIMMVVLFGC